MAAYLYRPTVNSTKASWGPLRKLLFGISPAKTTFAARGFRGGKAGAREHLERIGPVFCLGYHAALENADSNVFVPKLQALPPELQGFAFEGAAMGLALLDCLTPWRKSRVHAFAQGPGNSHIYMVYVGAGWVLARKPGNPDRWLERMDSLLRWLAMDGYGFHEGFFHWPRYIEGQPIPNRVMGYGRRAFDQGLGRSLWFIDGADVDLIPHTLARFPSERLGDLWSGLGLAATYAGGADREALWHLRESARAYWPQLAQGATFAAKARLRAGNSNLDTDLATRALCDLSAADAAQVTDDALEGLPSDGAPPTYEIWRLRVQQRFTNRPEPLFITSPACSLPHE